MGFITSSYRFVELVLAGLSLPFTAFSRPFHRSFTAVSSFQFPQFCQSTSSTGALLVRTSSTVKHGRVPRFGETSTRGPVQLARRPTGKDHPSAQWSHISWRSNSPIALGTTISLNKHGPNQRTSGASHGLQTGCTKKQRS